jgi:hypothetical protein
MHGVNNIKIELSFVDCLLDYLSHKREHDGMSTLKTEAKEITNKFLK